MWHQSLHQVHPSVLLENQTSIGTLMAMDTDTDDSLITYTVSGSEISITSHGVLTFIDAPDYETKSSYSATVTASDGTNSTTQDITITITDIDDTAPLFTSSAGFSAAENQTSIGTVTATDVDTDNASITFSISGSNYPLLQVVFSHLKVPRIMKQSHHTQRQ